MNKKCIICGKNSKEFDLCSFCFTNLEENDYSYKKEEHFDRNIKTGKINCVYVFFYSTKEKKVGYTNDLESRYMELKRQYPNNKLVYFREFTDESTARRYEFWLSKLTDRQLTNLINQFQNKLKKVDII